MKLKFLLFLCLAAIPLFSQTPDKAKLDQYFDALEANNKFMGSVALSQNGKTVYSRAIGYADVETGVKLGQHSKFRIGSISKMFTTVLVFKAIEDKKISLDDKIDQFFPTVPNASKITIGNLLNHRSGIHNFTNDADYGTYMTMPKTEAEMVALIAKAPSDFEPDSKADYSNSNFVLLTFLLEKTFRKKYSALVKEKITKPLQLGNTYVGGKIAVANHEAHSYTFSKIWEKSDETDLSIPLGAGAIVSTPTDLSRFIEALFAGKLLTATSLEQMKTIRDGFGMGMFQFPYGAKTGYGHTGGIDGFTAMLGYFPDDKLTVAMTSNGTNFENNNIALALLDAFYNKPINVPNFKSFAYTAEALDNYAGTYATTQIPLKITIARDGTALTAQATGQSAFPLESTEANIFKFDPAGIVLEFNPGKKELLLKQGGAVFTFTKE